MPLRHLSEEELRETIQRAREISDNSRDLSLPDAELEAYLQAGEEMEIPREALLQALRERQPALIERFAVGDQVFAPSVDGFWYPAEVLELGEHTAKVRFVSGSEHSTAVVDLKPLGLLPGRKLEANLKDWGWWNAVVERYDPATGLVHIVHDDWFSENEAVPLTRVRLAPKQRARKEGAGNPALRQLVLRWALLAGGIGVAAGVLLDRLLSFWH
jgi:hypothetical protein